MLPEFIKIRITWWGKIAVWIISLAMHLGLIEPTIECADRIAGWLLKHGAMKVEDDGDRRALDYASG